ncbi:hypothetical protein B5C26_05010 [Photorhabdus luminescens]|nr:hypothetical protein B5C26_05010 [Photorhabdus luminescens]
MLYIFFDKIVCYLARYHGLKVSLSGIYSVLCRHGLNRPSQSLNFKDKNENKVRRFQYTAIDDAMRIGALKVYKKHNQTCAIGFINYVV